MIVHDRLKWGVHVVGSDSIFAAHNFSHAVSKCEQINREILNDIELGFYSTDSHPAVFARIFVWTEGHGNHDPENTDWSDLC